MDKLLDLLPSGMKAYIGAILGIIGGIAMCADVIGEPLGFDVVNGTSSWALGVAAIGAGLGVLGIRHKQSKQDTTILAATVASEESTSATEDLTDAFESMPKTRGAK